MSAEELRIMSEMAKKEDKMLLEERAEALAEHIEAEAEELAKVGGNVLTYDGYADGKKNLNRAIEILKRDGFKVRHKVFGTFGTIVIKW